MPPGLTILHLDVDPWEIAKNYPVEVGIQGDPKATLPDLTEAIRRHAGGTRHPEAARRVEAARAAHEQHRADLARHAEGEAARAPIPPATLMYLVAESVPSNATIVDESISSGATLRHFLRKIGIDCLQRFGIRQRLFNRVNSAPGPPLAIQARVTDALLGPSRFKRLTAELRKSKIREQPA